ncbi:MULTISPECIES: RNA polymerase subunit sigma [Streptomyces]|uniref:Uncharacterized protein n=1 Tax=Streptomyces canarius TaxID=285453 RepID=A0ABQ3DDI8_9ACTN|nr:RNA polymerase subunit sigma [Streptomyces canarius]GHA78353.1 hypothetical protein GCM10010345_94610 [Streptomyces canarius]
MVTCTDAPATVVHGGDRPDTVSLVGITEGKIAAVYAVYAVYVVRAPEALAGVAVARRISR